MTEQTTNSQVPATPKPKTVLEDMDARRMFDTPADAINYLGSLQESLSDFDPSIHPFIMRGITQDDDGLSFDPAIYTDDMRVMVATLTKRVASGPSKVAAIVITPAPKLSAIIDSPLGMAWLAKIADKELNHVAVRALRNPSDTDSLDDLAEQMPLTLDAYVSTTREGGGILETYNELARGLIDAFAKQNKQWAKRKLTKPELKAAMSSTSYAKEYYAELEDRGTGPNGPRPSMFVMALNYGKQIAAAKGLDPAIFDRWLSTRDATVLNTKTDDDSEDFDLDALTFDDGKKSDDAEPAATEPAAPVAE